MELYDNTDCPFGKKVRIVLAEKELSYDTVHIELSQRQHLSEELSLIHI